MNKYLEQFKSEGFIGPIRAFDEVELHGVAQTVLHDLRQSNGKLCARRNRHLDWDVAYRLATAPAIVSIATEILGPELVLWRTNFFTAKPGNGLGWHRDEYRTLLSDPLSQISVHLGITEATDKNCVMVLPGSHKMPPEELAELGFTFIQGTEKGTYGAPNFWRIPNRSLNIVKMELRPGEFFVFHSKLLHASYDNTMPPNSSRNVLIPTNASSSLRVGLAVRITVPANTVFPAAFSEIKSRGDYCVRIVTK